MTHHDTKNLAIATNEQRSATRHRVSRRSLPMVMVAGVASLAILGGCAKTSKDHFTVGSTPSTYKTRHPIVLEEKEQTLDIPVASSSVGLPVASQTAVQGFAHAFSRSASGSITIMMPVGSPNQAAGRDVGYRIADTVRNTGVPSERIALVTYDASQHGSAAPVRLSYGAVKASVTGCGKWDRDLTEHSENRNYTNFGCASQSNLAAIIANPADLNGPRGSSTIDAARREQVIEGYRQGTETSSDRDSFGTITPVNN